MAVYESTPYNKQKAEKQKFLCCGQNKLSNND